MKKTKEDNMKPQLNDKHQKISYALRDQFKKLRDVFHSNEQRNNSGSGSDGVFDIIRKFNIDPSHGAKSTIGIRIKHDDKQDHGKINLYVFRKIVEKPNSRYGIFYHNNEKPLFAVSKDLTYDELRIILNQISLGDTESSVIEILNKLKLFGFDLNILTLSKDSFETLLLELKTETDNCFEYLEENLIKSYHESIKNKDVAETSLEIETEKLIENEEYQKLLKEKSELDLKISKFEKEFNKAKTVANIEKQKLDMLSNFMKEREKIVEKEKNDLLNNLSARNKMRVLISDLTYYHAVDNLLNLKVDFSTIKNQSDYFTFESVDQILKKK